MIRLAIFASGSGTNAENLIRYFANHDSIEVALIVCNRPSAGVIERAERLGVPVTLISRNDSPERLVGQLRENGIDFIILAGYLWLIPAELISSFPDRIINIHPALLPKYGGKGMYGMRVHEAIRSANELETGITIHLVNEKYDEGRVLFQATVLVERTDSPEDIAAKVHELEYRHFPEVVEGYILESQK